MHEKNVIRTFMLELLIPTFQGCCIEPVWEEDLFEEEMGSSRFHCARTICGLVLPRIRK